MQTACAESKITVGSCEVELFQHLDGESGRVCKIISQEVTRCMARKPRDIAGWRSWPKWLDESVAAASSGLLGGFVDAEFAHASTEGAGIHPEHLSGALWAFDAPTAILKHANNVVALNFL